MGRTRQSTVSLPLSIIKEIDLLIERLGYWPSRSAFVREACLSKIKEYKQNLRGRTAETVRMDEERTPRNPSRDEQQHYEHHVSSKISHKFSEGEN